MKSTIAASGLLALSFAIQPCFAAYAIASNFQASGPAIRQASGSCPVEPEAAAPAQAKSPIIYSTFHHDSAQLYAVGISWVVSGKKSFDQTTYGLAMPFTSSVDSTIAKVKLGLNLLEGENAMTVSIHADVNGMPGETLKQFTVTSLPDVPICPMVKTIGGVSVHAGSQYWLMVMPTHKNSSTYGGWNFSEYEGANTPFAHFINGVWQLDSGPAAAFEIVGD
ncbi:MAG TPA: hypothetical protein VLA61_21525 [Ideonella sp.]|uniref:hypothetical protein n=1 Tax=Ideonella sp. TaxID=1929293 RepID=UPI002C292E08|nr:hypothetical protein [Ideonella sp.]HSI50856.1 hypothetical protein [Ideonella sp.]